ncbi:27 kDa antigen Cfp30B [Pseudoruegeria aquimaris]|uniref:27 kDa antigen Cfp30B n=1 Tax=Pseudoruegeria aquimaris TaxID=393663 RepID=A0A1Y5SVL6_9RHOB|nr:VOC family protein [Pseudoruegeria aquimaris]SLN49378.1 27 kDa antigen Cfp30B [Pseudoruegeria aquimaris]
MAGKEEAHGRIWWSELMTRDVPAALRYYETVCGWQISEMPMQDPAMGTYYMGSRGGQPVAGIMDMGPLAGMEEVPPHWFTYVAVADLDAALASTRQQGGEVLREAFEVPGVGRIGIVTDPGGAALGLITPA